MTEEKTITLTLNEKEVKVLTGCILVAVQVMTFEKPHPAAMLCLLKDRDMIRDITVRIQSSVNEVGMEPPHD